MKKIIVIILALVSILALTVPCYAVNSGLTNNYVSYTKESDYYTSQIGMMQYRPRFFGTVLASGTSIVTDSGTNYVGMNYFPFPTNWYNMSELYTDEYVIPMQPIITTVQSIAQKNAVLLESTSNDVMQIAFGSNSGTIGNSAPDLYFDGLLGLLNDGEFSIYLDNLGETEIKVGFDGVLYFDYDDTYEAHEYEKSFLVGSDNNNAVSLDTLIREDVFDYYDTNCDMYFKGLFYIIINDRADIEEGLGYYYKLSIKGDLDWETVASGEITSTNTTANNVFDKFIELLYNGNDAATPAPSVPTGNITITSNGQYNIAKYATATINVPQENVTLENTNMFSWLISAASGFLSFEIAPNFTIGGILTIAVGFALIMWLLRVFLGG